MKFMVLMKSTAEIEAGGLPTREELETMISFNEKLAGDGVLLAAEGLRPSSKGTRMRFEGGRTTTVDGPFAETKELLAGFWIVQGKSRAEVVERFTHVPLQSGVVLEIRELYAREDFGDAFSEDLQKRTERVQL